MTAQEVAKQADVVILALPLSKFRNIPKEELAGKLVVDAMNYWWEVDGRRDNFMDPEVSSSQAVQQFLSESTVVKALSHTGYHDLHDEARQGSGSAKKAIAIAGDDPKSVEVVSELVSNLGFDPLAIGELSRGVLLEPGRPAFGANLNRSELSALLKR